MKMSNRLLHLIFPERCVVCGKVIAHGDVFCESCVIDDDKMEKVQCHNCGCQKDECICNVIANKNNYQLVAPFYYRDEARECVHQFKYGSSFDSGIFLAEKMTQTIKKEYGDVAFDLLTCVPTSKKRRKQKSFSTSEYLLKKISKKMKIKSNKKLLLKIKETPTQVSLSGNDRMTNLKDAFTVHQDFDIKDQVILLCDDVRTTGSTLNECSKALLGAGAKAVYCVTATVTQRF